MDIKRIIWTGFPVGIVNSVVNTMESLNHTVLASLDSLAQCHHLKHELCLLFICMPHANRTSSNIIEKVRTQYPLHPTVIFTQDLNASFLAWALHHRIFYVTSIPITREYIDHFLSSTLSTLKNDGFFSFVFPYKNEPVNVSLKTPKKTGRTVMMLQYINSHYDQRITLEGAAQICGVSSSHFSRLFKKENGLCFQDYLTQKRIEQAKHRLLLPNADITTVALSVGFHDHSYFTRVFRRSTGLTPTDYISLHQQESTMYSM